MTSVLSAGQESSTTEVRDMEGWAEPAARRLTNLVKVPDKVLAWVGSEQSSESHK